MKTKTKITKHDDIYVVHDVDADVFVDIACELYGFEYEGYMDLLLPVQTITDWLRDDDKKNYLTDAYDLICEIDQCFDEHEDASPRYVILSL
jgi:hypothetical protein